MKNLFKILIVLLLVQFTSVAQEAKLIESDSILTDSTFINYSTKDLVLATSTGLRLTYNLFEANNSERVFLIGNDGTIFYNPKYFCKCRDCKKKGLKKLKY